MKHKLNQELSSIDHNKHGCKYTVHTINQWSFNY